MKERGELTVGEMNGAAGDVYVEQEAGDVVRDAVLGNMRPREEIADPDMGAGGEDLEEPLVTRGRGKGGQPGVMKVPKTPEYGTRRHGTKPRGVEEDSDRVGAYLQLSDSAKEYGLLRQRGFGVEQAVLEMDRVRGIKRDRYLVKHAGKRLEEETQMYRLMVSGAKDLGEGEWRALSGALLLEIAQHGTGSARISAIEAIDAKRYEERYGTREAVERTLKGCEKRLAQLRAVEKWGNVHGVMGAGSDTEIKRAAPSGDGGNLSGEITREGTQHP